MAEKRRPKRAAGYEPPRARTRWVLRGVTVVIGIVVFAPLLYLAWLIIRFYAVGPYDHHDLDKRDVEPVSEVITALAPGASGKFRHMECAADMDGTTAEYALYGVAIPGEATDIGSRLRALAGSEGWTTHETREPFTAYVAAEGNSIAVERTARGPVVRAVVAHSLCDGHDAPTIIPGMYTGAPHALTPEQQRAFAAARDAATPLLTEVDALLPARAGGEPSDAARLPGVVADAVPCHEGLPAARPLFSAPEGHVPVRGNTPEALFAVIAPLAENYGWTPDPAYQSMRWTKEVTGQSLTFEVAITRDQDLDTFYIEAAAYGGTCVPLAG